MHGFIDKKYAPRMIGGAYLLLGETSAICRGAASNPPRLTASM
jgi:hypothetical protein